jgi:hypothetical protein
MPPPQDVEAGDMNEKEIQGLGRAAAFGAQGDAYAREHGQRPATIGLLLSTSPLALLIWYGFHNVKQHRYDANNFCGRIGEKFHSLGPSILTDNFLAHPLRQSL